MKNISSKLLVFSLSFVIFILTINNFVWKYKHRNLSIFYSGESYVVNLYKDEYIVLFGERDFLGDEIIYQPIFLENQYEKSFDIEGINFGALNKVFIERLTNDYYTKTSKLSQDLSGKISISLEIDSEVTDTSNLNYYIQLDYSKKFDFVRKDHSVLIKSEYCDTNIRFSDELIVEVINSSTLRIGKLHDHHMNFDLTLEPKCKDEI